MQNEALKFNSLHSANVQLYNDGKSAQTVSLAGSRVLRTLPSLVPGLRYKLIVEGKGKIDIFLTQNPESFAQQTRITLDKITYDTHVYCVQLKPQDERCSERSCYYNLVVEEESKPGSEHRRQMKDSENEPGKPWVLLFKVEENISLITMLTEDGQEENRLTFADDGENSDDFSKNKSTFRRNIEATEVCFGDRLLNQTEEVVLKVTRTEQYGFCEIAVMSEEPFRRLTSTSDSHGSRKPLKSFPHFIIRNNILNDPVTSQIMVTVPMAKSGWPMFIFSGCTLDLCSGTCITRGGESEETSPKIIKETTNEVEEQLCQVKKTLVSLELKLDQKEKDDQEYQRRMIDQMKANERQAEMQSTSLLELRDHQLEMMTNVKDTRKTAEKTSGYVRNISTKLNKRLSENKVSDDKSLELLNKYIVPNYLRIKNALYEAEFMDYLLQYKVLTERQHEEITGKDAGEQRRGKLLDILCKKPVSNLPNVRKALQESGHGELLRYFKEREDQQKQ